MTINTIKKLAVAAAICGSAGMASAATYTFDFGAANLPARLSHEFSAVGVAAGTGPTVTVTGRTENGVTRYVEAYKKNGIGLEAREARNDDHTIDSEGKDDVAVLTFSEAVSVSSLSFNYGTENSTFDLLLDPGSSQTVAFSGAIGKSVATGVADDVVSSVWGVQATEHMGKACIFGICWPTGMKDSYFKLAGMTVEFDDAPPPPAAVPLPAAGVLLLAGLGALGALRRRG